MPKTPSREQCVTCSENPKSSGFSDFLCPCPCSCPLPTPPIPVRAFVQFKSNNSIHSETKVSRFPISRIHMTPCSPFPVSLHLREADLPRSHFQTPWQCLALTKKFKPLIKRPTDDIAEVSSSCVNYWTAKTRSSGKARVVWRSSCWCLGWYRCNANNAGDNLCGISFFGHDKDGEDMRHGLFDGGCL